MHSRAHISYQNKDLLICCLSTPNVSVGKVYYGVNRYLIVAVGHASDGELKGQNEVSSVVWFWILVIM